MRKLLEEMSLEELWQLFPIVLKKYNSDYPLWYAEESAVIRRVVGKELFRINHIGSTAVPGLWAKPTVDILLEISAETDLSRLCDRLSFIGYRFSPQPDKPAPHQMFLKGYTPEGFAERVFHLHVRYPGDWDELYFRDWLRISPETVECYQELKKRLIQKFEFHRDNYTLGKSEFITHYSKLARDEFKGRYALALREQA